MIKVFPITLMKMSCILAFNFLSLLGLVCLLSPSFMAWCVSWCVARMVNHASLSALKVREIRRTNEGIQVSADMLIAQTI